MIKLKKCYLCFEKKINSYYCQCFPLKTKQFSYRRINKPCLTSKKIQSLKLKFKYFKLYRSGRISRQINNQMRNNVSKKVKQSHEKYFQNKFNLYRSDIRKSCTDLSLLLGRKKLRTSIRDLVVVGITLTGDIQMAEAMNGYSASVGSNLDSESPPAIDHENLPLQKHFEKSFYLFPVSTAECGKIITNLKSSKVDIDILPIRIHKKSSTI